MGILPRTAKMAFSLAEADPNVEELSMTVSVLEIYLGNNIRDLLHPAARGDQPLRIRDGREGVMVQGLKTAVVTSIADVLRYITTANNMRTVSTTQMNATSSRSHCIF